MSAVRVVQSIGRGVLIDRSAPTRDQGRPESGGYRYGYSPVWARRALVKAAQTSESADVSRNAC